MLFTTIDFFIFLAFVLLSIEIIRKENYQQLLLLAASYFFYWYSSNLFVFLLLFVTLITYYCGDRIYRSNSVKEKRIFLIIATASSLSILGYFKYFNFALESTTAFFAKIGVSYSLPILEILLPIGISFFTFQALSYVFDIYLGKLKPVNNIMKYGLFVAFFPTLLAGPIVRAREFLPQLNKKISISGENLQSGSTLIIWGLFKKMVIADNVGTYVNAVYNVPGSYGSLYVIGATILFGIQIYFDFSGYSDIAIGIAQIMGFKLPENFYYPYFSKNPQDFWNRWHMTLSRYIKDYVYIPLGGNRKGNFRTYVNLILAMAICGLWHGAAWGFVIWGIYNGLLLAGHRMMVKREIGVRNSFLKTDVGLFTKIMITQCFVFYGWMLFRANNLNDIVYFTKSILFFDFVFYPLSTALLALTFIFITGIILILLNKKAAAVFKDLLLFDYISVVSKLRLKYWFVYLLGMGLLIVFLSPPVVSEFIYFVF